MLEEYDSIMHNDVWKVVSRPEGKLVLTYKWLYKTRYDVDGSIEKQKGRFVVRGFSQIEGVDYEEFFALIVRYSLIKSILTLVA